MKKVWISFLGITCAAGLMSTRLPDNINESKKVLTITVQNIKDQKAPIVIGVFVAPETFPDKSVYKKYKLIPSAEGEATLHVTDLDYGQYAISMFQDKNNDYKLNTNFIGIPTEPYAFSNNFKPKFSAPGFEECKFTYNDRSNRLVIDLLN